MMSARLLRPVVLLAVFPGILAAQDNDPPARAGRVSSVSGTVGLQAAGASDWALAPLNYTVTSGDRLLTHERSRAEVQVGPFDVRLADSTDVSIVNLTDDFSQLGITRGTLRVSVYRLAARDSMEVDTPNGAMIIRSAGKYRVDVLEHVSTLVTVEDGVVELSGPALDYTVKRGQTIELTGTSAISASMVSHPRNTDFDAWSADRDSRQEASSYANYMSRDIPGGADLDRYGRWDYVATYGYVWRPTIVTVGWVPYRYGRWVWSGPWGYTWVEDAPWGFAPFHYGRWITIGGIWAWAPGPIIRRPCYAPALVVFIGGPRYHEAWFPLGWHEPYYPRYRHSDRYLREVNIANVRNITNVDEFVDVRHADRIDYTNRQATTVVASNVFGRSPIAHEATSVKPEEIAHAPIVRDRWEPPRLGSTAAQTQPTTPNRVSPFIQRRDATPTLTPAVNETPRPAEEARPPVVDPRRNSPLIYRNSPPSVTQRPTGQVLPRQTLGDTPASQPSEPETIDRGHTLIRRNQPAQLPERSDPAARSRPVSQPVTESPVVERPSVRVSTPRESAPRQPESRAAQPSPAEQPRGRAATSTGSGGASRPASRRPPG